MASDPNAGAPEVSAAGVTDAGRVRPINEDAFSSPEPSDQQQAEQKGRLYIVTDGMGGLNAGDLASEMAIETVTQRFYDSESSNPREALEEAIQVANGRILGEAVNRNVREKMGATITALVLHSNTYLVANAGNSRAYLIRDGRIRQLTTDHSWAAEKMAQGMSIDQIKTDPRRNAVTRALGIKPEIRIDFSEGNAQQGDIFVLCTDGLSGTLNDDAIRDEVTSNRPEEAAQRLLQSALDANAPDNVTVLVINVDQVPGGMAGAHVTAPFAAGAVTAALAAGEMADGDAGDMEPTPAAPAAGETVVTNAPHVKSKVKTKTTGSQPVVRSSGTQAAVVPVAAATGTTSTELPPDDTAPPADEGEEPTFEDEEEESRGGVSPWLLVAAVVVVGLLLGLVVRGLFFSNEPPPPVAVIPTTARTPTQGLPGILPGTPGAATATAGSVGSPVAGTQATATAAGAVAPTAAAAGASPTTAAQPTAAPVQPTATQVAVAAATASPVPPTAVPPAPTATPEPPTPVPPTATPVPPAPTNTPVPPPPATPTPRTAVATPSFGAGVVIRQQPTTASPQIGSIPAGTTVPVLSVVEGQTIAAGNPFWYQVTFGGVTGYAYSNTMSPNNLR